MPRFISPDGELTIETAVPREAVQLRAQGFKEEKARTAAVREADKSAYDNGGELPPGLSEVKNDTGKDEAVTKSSPKPTK